MTFGLNAENVWLEAGDRIRIRFGTRWPSALQFQLDNGGSPNDSDDIGLRMVLKESFIGNCKSVMIGNVSPN